MWTVPLVRREADRLVRGTSPKAAGSDLPLTGRLSHGAGGIAETGSNDMCSETDDPSMHDTPRESCQRVLFVRGEDRRCGQVVGVHSWQDHTGKSHVACPNHVDGMKRRYPESLPERVSNHGTLGLSSPWARGAFGPADVIEIENAIPPGFTVGVSGHRTNALVWVIDPEGREVTRWVNQPDAVWAARQAVAFIRRAAVPA